LIKVIIGRACQTVRASAMKQPAVDTSASMEASHEIIPYLFMGLISSTLVSKACRKGVVVEAVEDAWKDAGQPGIKKLGK
jgi:hypothetical protein